MVINCLQYYYCTKMPQNLSENTIMLTVSVSLVFCLLLKVLDLCMIQEISMVDESTSEVL
jgi:hypothetical protein